MSSRSSRPLPSRAVRRTVLFPAAGLLATSLLLAGCQADAAEKVSGPTSVSEHLQTVALDTPRLSSADNFRDLAGIDRAYSTGDGHLKPASVYRSNALDITEDDLATLQDLGISTVIDLRTDSEIEDHPDRVPAGADYVHIDIVGGGATAANPTEGFSVESPEDAATMLGELNRSFVTDAAMRAQFAQVVTAVAAADGPVVFHCTAGKDRAGWTSAVLQLAAGVTEQDIIDNYLATNDYSRDRIEATTEQIRASEGDEAADTYNVLLGVQEGFLISGLNEMKEIYGDVNTYLIDGLGLDVSTVQALKDKLVEA